MSAAWGNKPKSSLAVYARAEAAITVPTQTALVVVYTGDEPGEVELPASSGQSPAGFIYQSAAAGELARVATGDQFWVPVSEAIAIDDDLMAIITTGEVGILTTGLYKCGRALTAQSTVGGYVQVEAMIGPEEA